jgi:hypothetical protein
MMVDQGISYRLDIACPTPPCELKVCGKQQEEKGRTTRGKRNENDSKIKTGKFY